jgi:hypothetical protein
VFVALSSSRCLSTCVEVFLTRKHEFVCFGSVAFVLMLGSLVLYFF